MVSFLVFCFFRNWFQARMRAMIYWDGGIHSGSFSGKSFHGTHQNSVQEAPSTSNRQTRINLHLNE